MIVQRHPRNAHPKRIVFGLPHNYGKKEQHKDVEPERFDRRASPLFIHVHQAAQNHQPITVLTFLPSRFLPAGQTRLSVGGASVELDTSSLWEPVETFLERMLNKTPEPHHRKESFGLVTEVAHG
jgi:CRISPR-associated protein Cmr1